jgi:hypothetical protein
MKIKFDTINKGQWILLPTICIDVKERYISFTWVKIWIEISWKANKLE